MFQSALPIFLEHLHTTRDVQAGFHFELPSIDPHARVILRCAAATFYRAYLNGGVAAHGPARAAHGHARVDDVDLTARLRPGVNHLAVEVAGYAFDCIYTTGDPSFLAAELTADGRVIAATDVATTAVRLTQRRPAERFSHARVTGEVYALDAAYADWRLGRFDGSRRHAVERVAGPAHWLPRGVPLPDLRRRDATTVLGVRSFETDPSIVVPPIGPLEHGPYLDFVATLPERPATECARERPTPLADRVAQVGTPTCVFRVPKDTGWRTNPCHPELPIGVDLDFGTLQAGFLGVDIDTPPGATVDLVFNDVLGDAGEFRPRGGDMNNVIRLHLPGGRVRFEAFEPHCVRYLRVIFRNAPTATLHAAYVLDDAYPAADTHAFSSGDADLDRIYDAARLTLRLNTLDVFMDCPGRERAGWLCDSLFSGRAMHLLFGDASVERAMLENFLHAPEADHAPGHFPQCYPGEPIHGDCFIPNWSMFLAIELAEYVARTGDTALRDAFAARIDRLVNGLRASENFYGLLERLPGTVFIDWSDSNQAAFKKPISTATNALYAVMLDSVAALYGRADLAARAAGVRKTLRDALPRDRSLPDALREENGTLVAGGKSSEATQYYLFWAGVAEADGAHAAVWNTLRDAHGPASAGPASAGDLSPSNVFIGLYLRFELLARLGERDLLRREMKALFLPMLERGPGTLWEHRRLEGSVCHGFASHAAVWIARDLVPSSPGTGRERVRVRAATGRRQRLTSPSKRGTERRSSLGAAASVRRRPSP